MFTFLYNLFFIATKVPSAVGILKTILDIVGSEAVQEILRLIHETTQRFKAESPETSDAATISTLPATERIRLVQRLKKRIAQRMLGDADTDFALN